MTVTDQEAYYLLSRISGIGPKTAHALLEYFGTSEELLSASQEAFRNMGQSAQVKLLEFSNPVWRKNRLEERELLKAKGIQLLYKGQNDYPWHLNALCDAPMVLYATGNPMSTRKKVLSIVGTRAMTFYGKKVIEELLHALRPDEVVIASGLALGVDGFAQELAAERGFEVVALVAHGLDITYPRRHGALRGLIERNGCILSEFFTGVPPLAGNFISRNRLIAGIADATLVVESAQSGGSLTTADFAHGYQKELLCVPGRLTDRYSAGCNRLLGTLKAQCYTGPESIIEALGITRAKNDIKTRPTVHLATSEEKRLYAFLVKNGRSYPSSMLKKSGIDRTKLYGVLARLTLSGAITHHNDNSYEV